MANKVILRPITRPRWHNLPQDVTIDRAHTLEAQYIHEKGGYYVPFLDGEQKRLEKELNIDLSPIYNPNKPHEFYTSEMAKVELDVVDVELNKDNPYDLIKYRICQGSEIVANSLEEYQQGKWPRATHYLVDEDHDHEVKSTVFEKNSQAFELLNSMPVIRKRHLVQIMLKENVQNATDKKLNAKIAEAMAKDIDEFLRIARLSPEETTLRAMVNFALGNGTFSQRGDLYYYGDEVMGGTITDVLAKLAEPEYSSLKLTLLDKFNKN